MKIGIYPGSFDPITNGHLDVINRARHIFDKVIVAVARNATKDPLFTSEERVHMIEENLTDRPNISVIAFDGLIVDLAKEKKAVARPPSLTEVPKSATVVAIASLSRRRRWLAP